MFQPPQQCFSTSPPPWALQICLSTHNHYVILIFTLPHHHFAKNNLSVYSTPQINFKRKNKMSGISLSATHHVGTKWSTPDQFGLLIFNQPYIVLEILLPTAQQFSPPPNKNYLALSGSNQNMAGLRYCFLQKNKCIIVRTNQDIKIEKICMDRYSLRSYLTRFF
jgi:hypothetical protein